MKITYQLANFEGQLVAIQRKIDGVFDASIPLDEANTDYQDYLEWVAEGNTAEEAA
jgi:hypothetical protein|tara:strand:- start:239 stop:406 length:168 start_codon:yes stop_codon:yes gene_type:complete